VRRQHIERRLRGRPGDIIGDDIHRAAGGLPVSGGEILGGKREVDDRVGAEVPGALQRSAVAAGGDHPAGAKPLGDAHRNQPGNAGGAEDQDGFAGTQARPPGQRQPSGEPGISQRRGKVVGDLAGNRERVLRVDQRAFGHRAERTDAGLGIEVDTPAVGGPRHALPAEDERSRGHGEIVSAARDRPIQAGQGSGANVDDERSVPCPRLNEVAIDGPWTIVDESCPHRPSRYGADLQAYSGLAHPDYAFCISRPARRAQFSQARLSV
jgi:hypothetical protein